MDKTRLLLADEHAMFRDGLRAALQSHRDLVVVGEADDAEAVVQMAAELRPDVVVMGVVNKAGVAAVREMLAAQNGIKVVVVDAGDSEQVITDMIQAGVHGYLMKHDRVSELVRAVHGAMRGDMVIDAVTTSRVVLEYRRLLQGDGKQALDFSERERHLLRLLATGNSNQEIADELCLSKQTIKNLLAAIYRKLGVDNRTEAVVTALSHEVIKVG